MSIDDKLMEYMNDRFNRLEKKMDTGFGLINGRVRKLENWKSYTTGALAIFVLIVGAYLKWSG